MNPLFTALFGFVAHPFVMLSIVVTQLTWSMWIFDADLEHPPVILHLQTGAAALCAASVILWSECRPRATLKYHCEWSWLGGRIFQGQLRLGMPWIKQFVLGMSLGLMASLVDEWEVLTALTMSPGSVEKLRAEHGPRAGATHVAHAHDMLLFAFVVHGWLWTLCTATILGAWTNAARLHSAEAILTVD